MERVDSLKSKAKKTNSSNGTIRSRKQDVPSCRPTVGCRFARLRQGHDSFKDQVVRLELASIVLSTWRLYITKLPTQDDASSILWMYFLSFSRFSPIWSFSSCYHQIWDFISIKHFFFEHIKGNNEEKDFLNCGQTCREPLVQSSVHRSTASVWTASLFLALLFWPASQLTCLDQWQLPFHLHFCKVSIDCICISRCNDSKRRSGSPINSKG